MEFNMKNWNSLIDKDSHYTYNAEFDNENWKIKLQTLKTYKRPKFTKLCYYFFSTATSLSFIASI